MPLDRKQERSYSPQRVTVAALLIIGLFFPTSTNGQHSELCVLLAFAILLGLFFCLVYKRGTQPRAVALVALPILVLLTACTLRAVLTGNGRFDPGIFVKFCSLALLLTLNLRGIFADWLIERVFFLANVVNVIWGIAILVGSQWISDFLPRYYWSFYPELIPYMITLHKPVLTLGTHASAAFFLYVFFWINWEVYIRRNNFLSLFFALSYFVFLLGLTSFSAIGFGAVALVQMMIRFWKSSRKKFVSIAVCAAILVPVGLYKVSDTLHDLWSVEQDSRFFNLATSGPLARYGEQGGSRRALDYIVRHPLSQIGFAAPPDLAGGPDALGDSGPTEYVLRGSLALCILMYFGLYRFLRFNLTSRVHLIRLFLTMVAFESAFSLVVYIRTLYLLPFFLVYLNTAAALDGAGPALSNEVSRPFQPALLSGEESLQGAAPS